MKQLLKIAACQIAFRTLLIALISSATSFCYSQLVNIESQRIQTDSVRFTGNANFNFSYQKNNTRSLIQVKTSAVYQIKTKSYKDIFLVLGNYDFSKTRTAQLSNSAFGHLRYNRRINPSIKFELYTQLQTNQLLNLRSRYIAGTGLRFKFKNEKLLKSYLGITAFYEYEETQEDALVFRNDFRMSNYFVLSLKLPNSLGELTSTTYYQSLFDRFSDYRVTSQSNVVLNIVKHVALTITFNYFFDQNPPEGINKETVSFNSGLRLTF